MKKILFINHEESRTGAPKIVFEIANAMKSDFDVVMLSMMKGAIHDEFYETFDELIYTDERFPNEDKIREIILRVNPDLVYVNCMVAHKYAVISKKLDILTIYHLHELEMSMKFCLDEEEIHNFNESADVFIACSGKVKEFLINRLGCDASKIALSYEFISVKDILSKLNDHSIEGVDDKIKKEYGLIIAGIGTADSKIQIHRKGVDLLIDAYNILKKKENKMNFIWIGPYDSNLLNDNYRGFRDLDDNFEFIGEKENPIPYLQTADIFVLPSREDPFPLVALEAMALGKPIIAFKDGGGIPEAIKDCGVIVDKMDAKALANAIIKLAKDKKKMDRCGRNGQDKVKENYDIEIIMPKIKKLIHDLLNF